MLLFPKPASKGTLSSVSGHSRSSATPADDRTTLDGGMYRPSSRHPQPRRAPLSDYRDSIANSDIRDVVLVHINVQAPSPPGTLDTSMQERSLTPIPEADSDSDSLWIPRSGSPDSYAGSLDSLGTLESGASWTLDDIGPGHDLCMLPHVAYRSAL
ncbi:hypothetical protein K466DRAFT_311176 [Polyporus arcularius HHB13444]|uniref:Uncharacterized protein n=1 Tax=Polyporus arcularius HHB13444 TaxID=1314778 RepID=A0A5C3P8Q3_9APHY|nr:hypothetical protein K466DRAFT_311176 [Polyporus arcularius HHB13444]